MAVDGAQPRGADETGAGGRRHLGMPPGYDSGQRHEVHRCAFHDYIVKRYAMRVAGCIAILLLWLSCVRSSPCEAAPHDARWSEGARRQLIGAWRLAAIEYSGPQGDTVD